MNQRIRSLAEQAGLYFGKDVHGEFVSFSGHGQSLLTLEDFATSIVNECINVLDTSKKDDPYSGGTYSGQTSLYQKNAILDEQITIIRKQFGART